MTPQWIIWIIWTLTTMGRPMVRTDFSPYDGPLAARQLQEAEVEHGALFTIIADSPELEGFERWLRRHPIHVRAPDHRYVVWGLQTIPRYRGEIFVTIYNTLLQPHEQPLGPHYGDMGSMLEWAFSVLDHYALPYAPERQHHQKSRQQLVEVFRRESEPIDWQHVAERLRATGRAVPADLFEQPTR